MSYGGGGGGSGGGGSGSGSGAAGGIAGGQAGSRAYTRKLMGDRAIVQGRGVTRIDYWSMVTNTGSVADFGDGTQAAQGGAGVSDGSRGLFGSGYLGPPTVRFNNIDYVTIGVPANAVDFGDVTEARSAGASAMTGSRGIWACGTNQSGPVRVNTIDFVTINTLGNASDFGDDIIFGQERAGCSSIGRQCFFGAYGGPSAPSTDRSNVITYINGDVLGNAQDFGDLTEGKSSTGGCSDGIRGLISHGYPPANEIDYITINTASNASEFGDQTVTKESRTGVGNGYRAFWCGGAPAVNTIDWCTIQTLGNCVDWGDLTDADAMQPAASGD